MSTTLETREELVTRETRKPAMPWALWARQTFAIMRLELRKNFLGRRALLLYLLATLPLVPLAILAAFPPPTNVLRNVGDLGILYAALYGGLILRTLVFFGCAWVFMNLFRGEVVDRSLHYYFLTPARREVLVIGKYLSGMVATVVLFCLTTLGSFLVLYLWRFPEQSADFILNGPGLRHLLAYVSITALACVGYGAAFLFIGLFFRNPIIPALLIYGWEWINFLLPPLLKKVSVIHYLQSLTPVPMPEGPFAVLAEPLPGWVSVTSLFIFSATVLVLAALHIRHMEISYAGE